MKKFLFSALISIASLVSYAQVQQTWAYSHIAQLFDQYVDANGNIYQVGLAYSASFDDMGYLTIKHDKNGNEIWRHFAPGLEKRAFIAVDASGNVYVAGSTGNPAFATISDDTYFYILKLNSNGVFQWSNTFWQVEGSSPYSIYGKPNGLELDPDGTPYITGVFFTAFTDASTYSEQPDSATGDFVTIKYDAATGNRIWVRQYNGATPGTGFDEGRAIAIDPIGNIYVSGTSQLNGFHDIVTIKYDPLGNQLWSMRYNNSDPAYKYDYAGINGLKLDVAGNVIVAGGARANSTPSGGAEPGKRIIIKYTFTGFQLWVRERYVSFFSSGPITTDNANNIIESADGETKKYNAAGDLIWTYNQDFNDMATDADNNIYSVRTCLRNDNGLCGNGVYYGFTTRKLSGAGSLLWEKTYVLFANGGVWIGLDADKNVYTSGSELMGGGSQVDYHTVRYSQCQITCPANITVNAPAGTCSAVVNYAAATTTGYCGSDITYSHASGSTFSVGTTTVTVTSTETGATCTFDITVVDNQNPVITCPNDITVNTDPGVCYASSGTVNAITPGATDNCSPVNVTGVRSDGASLGANYPAGITTITWTATDPSNNTATCSQTVNVIDNVPPVITNTSVSQSVLSPPNHKMIDIYLGYTVTDNCSATTNVTVTSDEPETGLSNGDLGPDIVKINNNHWQLRAERDGKGDGRVYTMLITATDGSGNTSTATETVVVAHNIGSPHAGHTVRVGSTVNFSGTFWDVPGNKHTAKWFVDDKAVKASVKEPSGMRNGTVTGSYRFTAPGVYKLRMEITDQDGTTTTTSTNGDLEAIVVVYDPNGGYTYGGGYFASPAGALRSDPLAKGDAGFGFTINYYKTATMPKGETQFDFKVGDFEYNALNFDYLVISNSMAQFRGTGKIIGGQSGVGFIMTVIDGELDGTGIDKVRMKIYNKNTNEIYYDNLPGASDAALPVMPVGEQSDIVIAGNNAPVTRRQEEGIEERTQKLTETFTATAYPNPFRRQFSLSLHAPISGIATIEFFDLSGARVHTERKPVTAGINTFQYPALHRYGNLIYKVSIGDHQVSGKLIKP